METMIPPQAGMILRTKNKKRGHKKREKAQIKIKNERKIEKGQCYYPFTTLVLQSSTMIFKVESLSFRHFHILVGIYHWNIQAKFYNVKFPLVYESVNIGDSLS